MGAAFAHAQQGFLASGDDRVAAKDQVGGGHAHAGGADLSLAGCHDHMAPGGTAFLGQAGRVLRDDAFAFQVRGHAQQLADGDHASTAYAGHHHAPGMLEVGLSGFWEFTQNSG